MHTYWHGKTKGIIINTFLLCMCLLLNIPCLYDSKEAHMGIVQQMYYRVSLGLLGLMR